MPLTPAQLTALKAEVTTNPLYAADLASGNDTGVAAALNADAAPDFWVWRTSVFESEFTRATSADGTTWSWPAYIARTVQEQNAWARMFMGGQAGMNPSLANVRQGLADIFSGSASSAPAQRTHLTAVSRRRANRAERLFAAGTGSAAAPAVMAFEGKVTPDDVSAALRS